MATPPISGDFSKTQGLGENFYYVQFAFPDVKTGFLKIKVNEAIEPKLQTIEDADIEAEIENFWQSYEQTVQTIEDRNKIYDTQHASEETKDMIKTVTALTRGRASDDDISERRKDKIPTPYRKVLDAIREQKKTAGFAAYEIFTKSAEQYTATPGMEPMAEEFKDILKVFLRKYDPSNQPSTGQSHRPDDIIIAENMSPGDIADYLDDEGNPLIKGIILDKTTITSHVVIACKAAGLSIAWFSDGIRPQNLKDGMRVVLDGDEETLLFGANQKHWKAAQIKEKRYEQGYSRLLKKAHDRRNPFSRDEREFKICVNGDTLKSAHDVNKYNAHSMGLIRLENYVGNLPKYERKLSVEQCREYILGMLKIAQRSNMTFRLMDATEDKVIEGLSDKDIAEIDKNFMTAFLHIRHEMPKKKIHVMVPLVLKPEDLAGKQRLMNFAAEALGIESYQLGSMAEDPEFLDNLESGKIKPSFISVGTNDMTTSTLGINRFDQKDADKNDPTHPDVLNNIFRVILHQRELGGEDILPTSVCGDMASQPENFAILAGMGVRRISVAGAISPIIKELARNIDTGYRFWELQKTNPKAYAKAQAKAQKSDNPSNAWALFQRLSIEDSRDIRVKIRTEYNRKYLGLDEHQKIMIDWTHPQDHQNDDPALDRNNDR